MVQLPRSRFSVHSWFLLGAPAPDFIVGRILPRALRVRRKILLDVRHVVHVCVVGQRKPSIRSYADAELRLSISVHLHLHRLAADIGQLGVIPQPSASIGPIGSPSVSVMISVK